MDGTDPRLCAVSHYRRTLWKAVEHAIDLVVTFVNTPFDEMAFAEDRRLIALFIPFPSHELLSQPGFFEEARRFL